MYAQSRSPGLNHRVRLELHLGLEGLALWHIGHIDAVAMHIELPAVVHAAQSTLFIAAKEQGRAAMGAIGIHQARAPLGVPEQDEVFAEDLHPDRVTVGSGQLLGEGDREPEASKELAHGRTRAGSTDEFVFLARQHVAPPSQVCQPCVAYQRSRQLVSSAT